MTPLCAAVVCAVVVARGGVPAARTELTADVARVEQPANGPPGEHRLFVSGRVSIGPKDVCRGFGGWTFVSPELVHGPAAISRLTTPIPVPPGVAATFEVTVKTDLPGPWLAFGLLFYDDEFGKPRFKTAMLAFQVK